MDINRLGRVARIIARYGFGTFLRESSVPGYSKADRAEAEVRKPASERFRLMLEELGPIFIKFGQLLSTRPDILPPDFIESLSRLQEKVAPLPWEIVDGELAAHLPVKRERIFSAIEQQPMATASVSQVHRATLKTGEEVVVKVRRPDIEEMVESDLELLRGLARLLESTIVEVSRYEPKRWVDEFAEAMGRELDLMNEVETISTFRKNGSQTGRLVIPRVYEEFSSSRVLVMEYLEGIPVTHEEDRTLRRRSAEIILAEAYKQIFLDGFFHADPHPGNLRLLEDGRIGLIDFGLVGRLSPRMREILTRLALAVAFRDAERVAKIVSAAGMAKGRIDLGELSRGVEELFEATLDRSLAEIDTTRTVLRFMDLVSRHGITLPPELALLAKTGVNLEGVIRTLDPGIDISKALLPYLSTMVTLPDDPGKLMNEAMKQFLRVRGMLDELPLQIDQIMMDLSSGKTHLNVSSRQVEGLVPALRELGALLAIGMVAAASLVAAALLVIPYLGGMKVYGVPVLPVIAGAMAVYALFLMGTVVAWALLRGRDLRIRLGRWIRLFEWGRKRRRRRKTPPEGEADRPATDA